MKSERQVLLETRLRNLKRKQAKLSKHAELADEYFKIGKEIRSVKHELNLM